MGLLARWFIAVGAAVLWIGVVGADLQADAVFDGGAEFARVADERPGQPASARSATPNERKATAATLLARPLFNADRRPIAAGAAFIAPTIALPRLTAIIHAPGLRQAVFVAPGSDRSVQAVEGDILGEFRVTSVGADSVELRGAFGRATVHLQADETYRSALAVPPDAPVAAQAIDPARREAEFESDQ